MPPGPDGAASRAPRRGGALRWIPLILAALVVAEIVVLIQVGRWIGVLPTFGLIILIGLIGMWLVAHEGRGAWRGLRRASATDAGRYVSDAALILVAGLLLLLPGFLSDIVAILIVAPPTRSVLRRVISTLVGRKIKDQTAAFEQRYGPIPRAEDLAAGRTRPAYDRDPDHPTVPGEVIDPEDPARGGAQH